MDKELDKLIDAAIEDAFIEQRERYSYNDEVANVEVFCCEECASQATYFLKV